MSTRITKPLNNLQTILSQVVQAYELAQATRIQIERQAQDELQQHLDALQQQQQIQTQQIGTDYKRAQAIAAAEQERLGDLLATIEQVRETASKLLEKAGLAHIEGVSLPLNDAAPPDHHHSEAAAKAFAATQVAYIDLRTALLRLATALVAAGQWKEARQIVEPLLADQQSPLYAEALNLFCEAYYQLASAALKAENWAEAQQGFTRLLAMQVSL